MKKTVEITVNRKKYIHISALPEGVNLIKVRKHRGQIKASDFILVHGGLYLPIKYDTKRADRASETTQHDQAVHS